MVPRHRDGTHPIAMMIHLATLAVALSTLTPPQDSDFETLARSLPHCEVTSELRPPSLYRGSLGAN